MEPALGDEDPEGAAVRCTVRCCRLRVVVRGDGSFGWRDAHPYPGRIPIERGCSIPCTVPYTVPYRAYLPSLLEAVPLQNANQHPIQIRTV